MTEFDASASREASTDAEPAVLRELPNQLGGFAIPDEKLTPNGGAVAIGHPFGAPPLLSVARD